MVEGVEVKVPSFIWVVTCFVMFLAAMNPLVELKCKNGAEKNCKNAYVSKFDVVKWNNWTGVTYMQADGNLTMLKLTHGFVSCNNSCDDCDENQCLDWSYEEMKKLDDKLREKKDEVGGDLDGLPDFLKNMCHCADYCHGKGNCENGFIKLPGNNSMDSNWIDMDCKTLEADHNATENGNSGKICGLVELYTQACILTIACIVMMILLQITMLGLEYVNFDSFLDGRCRCLFRPYRFKKALYMILACLCLFVQVYTFILVKTKTDKNLEAYFEVMKGEFEYNWNTRGYFLFIIAIGGSCLTILTMVFFMHPVERQKKKSYRNDIHGISTESVLARKF